MNLSNKGSDRSICFKGCALDTSDKSYLDRQKPAILIGHKTILSKHIVHFLDHCPQTEEQSHTDDVLGGWITCVLQRLRCVFLTIVAQLLFDLAKVRASYHSNSNPLPQILKELCHVWRHTLETL